MTLLKLSGVRFKAQKYLFKFLMADGNQTNLSKVARAVAELGRASVVQKKWQAEVRAKAEAAASHLKDRQEGGLDATTVAEKEIRAGKRKGKLFR